MELIKNDWIFKLKNVTGGIFVLSLFFSSEKSLKCKTLTMKNTRQDDLDEN